MAAITMDEEHPGKAEAVAQVGAPTRRLAEPLTPRELRILGMVCDGEINREIAIKLQVSADGVKYHLRNIYEKLGVNRRTHAVAIAVHERLITPEWLVQRSRGRQ